MAQNKKYRFLSLAPDSDNDDDIGDGSDMEDGGAVGNSGVVCTFCISMAYDRN